MWILTFFWQIFSVFSLLIIVILIIRSFRYKDNATNAAQKIETAKAGFLEKEKELQNEIKRLQYITKTYKTNKNIQNNITELPVSKSVVNEFSSKTETEQLKELSKQKQELEDEKSQFIEKNKKLWEQSLAIHKEKERIDNLKANIEQRHKEITDSIRYAQRIQSALLPDTETIKQWFDDYFIFWKPRDIVSGDFFWINKVEDSIVILASDCTGHGVPGAFMSMLGIAFLNEIINKTKTQAPDVILDELRKYIKSSLKQSYDNSDTKDGMDMAICILNKTRKKLFYAGANNPLYIIRNKELIEYKATKNPVGIYRKEKPFECNEIDVLENDAFYIFSDGFVDQVGGLHRDKYKTKRFKEFLIHTHQTNISMQEMGERIENEFIEWKDDYKQIDDVLVIGFRFPV